MLQLVLLICPDALQASAGGGVASFLHRRHVTAAALLRHLLPAQLHQSLVRKPFICSEFSILKPENFHLEMRVVCEVIGSLHVRETV